MGQTLPPAPHLPPPNGAVPPIVPNGAVPPPPNGAVPPIVPNGAVPQIVPNGAVPQIVPNAHNEPVICGFSYKSFSTKAEHDWMFPYCAIHRCMVNF